MILPPGKKDSLLPAGAGTGYRARSSTNSRQQSVPSAARKLATRMADATYAFERERYQEARRILRTLADEVPGSAAVRELYGLVLYRTGQWVPAARQLERYRQLSGSFDQHPVLADSYRALRRYDEAEAIWEELREASPSGDLVAEGRIVAAGCRADQGDLAGAIALLRARRTPRQPSAGAAPAAVVRIGGSVRAGGGRAPGARVVHSGCGDRSGRLRRSPTPPLVALNRPGLKNASTFDHGHTPAVASSTRRLCARLAGNSWPS